MQKVAIPESQNTGQTAHDLIRHYQKLVEQAMERVIAAGPPSAVIVPDVLEKVFGARMEVLMHLGMPVVVDSGAGLLGVA